MQKIQIGIGRKIDKQSLKDLLESPIKSFVIWTSFEIVEILGWELGLVDLEEFNQNLIRCRNHNILPDKVDPFVKTII